jgi:hypothetical protein
MGWRKLERGNDMRGQWQLKAVRQPGHRRSCVKRADGSDRFTRATDEVPAFVARAQKHLAPAGVARVEAWSAEQMEFDFVSEIAPRLVFTIRPHRNGRDSTADENELHHGGWFRTLASAADYALFRASGIAGVHVLDRDAKIQRVILVDQRGYDAVPTIGPSIGQSNA